MSEAIINLLGQNYFVFFLLIGLAVVLRHKSTIGDINLKNGWLVFVSIFVLSVCDFFETVSSWNESYRNLRVFLSVMGYWLRPMVSLSFLSLTVDITKKKNRLFLVPAIINIVVFATAFFAKWTFYFDEDYSFVRGPLGYTVFLVSYFYVISILIITIKTFKSGGRNQGAIMMLGAVGVIVASVLEASGIGRNLLNSAVLIAVLLYYLYVFSEVTARDPVTHLFNRQTFYEDMKVYEKRLFAVIAVDMNGLKTINDTYGHKAGDDAIIELANVLKCFTNNSTYAYRVGGDEFYMLVMEDENMPVTRIHENMLSEMEKVGVKVSSGYAIVSEEESLQAAIEKADERMYESKALYYEQTGLDRRKT